MYMDILLTIKEVANRLKVCDRTILRHIKSKKLKASKVGHWRVSEKDLQTFIKAGSNGVGN